MTDQAENRGDIGATRQRTYEGRADIGPKFYRHPTYEGRDAMGRKSTVLLSVSAHCEQPDRTESLPPHKDRQ